MLAVEDLINAAGLLGARKADLTLGRKAELIDATPWHNDFSFEQMKKLARYMDAYEVTAGTVVWVGSCVTRSGWWVGEITRRKEAVWR